jgi:hypothetical protein
MPSPSVDAALISCLKSIRDVAHDLGLEIDRARSDNWSSVRAMVAHIQHKTDTALKLTAIQRPDK